MDISSVSGFGWKVKRRGFVSIFSLTVDAEPQKSKINDDQTYNHHDHKTFT